jgi:hypothetical protein
MKTPAHTPGPWKVAEREGCYRSINGVAWYGLAKVVTRMDGTERDCKDGAANARLIAAAPDLLAACILAAAHHQGFHSVPGKALRAAIAKALGATKVSKRSARPRGAAK